MVVDGVMCFRTPQDHVYAVDTAAGMALWHQAQSKSTSLLLCCGAGNRGVAVADGKVLFGALDGHVVALDARTGHRAWQTLAASKDEGHSCAVAPQVVNPLRPKAATGILNEPGPKASLLRTDPSMG